MEKIQSFQCFFKRKFFIKRSLCFSFSCFFLRLDQLTRIFSYRLKIKNYKSMNVGVNPEVGAWKKIVGYLSNRLFPHPTTSEVKVDNLF